MTTPAEILDQMNRPSEWTGWVPTFTGKGYRPWAKEPGEVDARDIAYGLAHTYRYGGQTDPAITVAEHCLLGVQIIQTLWPALHLERAFLLHDAAEAYLHDIQGPLRSSVIVRLKDEEFSWSESDRRVTINAARQFGVTAKDLAAPEVKAADILAVCFEKRDCKNLGDDDWGLPEIPEAIKRLKLRFLSPEQAYRAFLFTMKDLGLWGA